MLRELEKLSPNILGHKLINFLMAGSREKDNWSKKGKMLYFVTYLYEYMKNAYLPCFNVTNIRLDFDKISL